MSSLVGNPIAAGALDARQATSAPCFHCGLPIDAMNPVEAQHDGRSVEVCCHGCAAAVAFIAGAGLDDYYRLRTRASGIAAGLDGGERDARIGADQLDGRLDDRLDDYADPVVAARFLRTVDAGSAVDLAVEGMHCAGCAWLLEHGLGELDGVRDVHVELAAGRTTVTFDAARSDLARVLHRVRALGFDGAPARHDAGERLRAREYRRSLRAVGIAGIVAVQVMMLAVADYAGLLGAGMDPSYRALLLWAQLVLASVAVFGAAGTFFRGAHRALQARRLTMDVPVALAIALAYGASIALVFLGDLAAGTHLYFDSVTMFVFFLLVGRHLELGVRQRFARGDEGLRELLPAIAHRVDPHTRVNRAVPADLLQIGDRIRLQPGEHVAADARVLHGEGSIDRALLTGESTAVRVAPGAQLEAGVRVLDAVFDAEVTAPTSESTAAGIPGLLDRARAQRPRIVSLADRIAGRFLATVLVLASAAGLLWWWIDPARVLDVVLATLIVTCPCALSLATPTALTAASLQLRRRGVVVAAPDALETLAVCDEICFDKTGTLTEPLALDVQLASGEPDALDIAAALERDIDHPIARAFARTSSSLTATAVRSDVGRGVEGTVLGRRWRLGRGRYVGRAQDDDRIHLAAVDDTDDGAQGRERTVSASFTLREPLRSGAAETARALRERGLELSLLSGDHRDRTRAVAARLDVDAWEAGADPSGKLAWLRARMAGGRHVVCVGDGINDAPALGGASASIAVGSASAFARDAADFVLLSRGVDALPEIIDLARRTRVRIRLNLLWAVAYNVCAVPLALAGVITPWLAALGMSVSSLVVTFGSARLLREEVR